MGTVIATPLQRRIKLQGTLAVHLNPAPPVKMRHHFATGGGSLATSFLE